MLRMAIVSKSTRMAFVFLLLTMLILSACNFSRPSSQIVKDQPIHLPSEVVFEVALEDAETQAGLKFSKTPTTSMTSGSIEARLFLSLDQSKAVNINVIDGNSYTLDITDTSNWDLSTLFIKPLE